MQVNECNAGGDSEAANSVPNRKPKYARFGFLYNDSDNHIIQQFVVIMPANKSKWLQM